MLFFDITILQYIHHIFFSSIIYDLKYELFRYPPFSSDLALSDLFPFSVLKDHLGKYYNDRSSLSSAIHQRLNSLSTDDFITAIQKHTERWQDFEYRSIYLWLSIPVFSFSSSVKVCKRGKIQTVRYLFIDESFQTNVKPSKPRTTSISRRLSFFQMFLPSSK